MTQSNKPPLLFVLSIDTEEEWDWSGPFPEKNFDVDNVQHLPKFHSICHELGIKPTYFVDYAVANDESAADVLRQAQQLGNCEIGAHLHPWCNPPYFGAVGEAESHVVNLPKEQVEQKLQVLTNKLVEQFGTQPRSFRTGRWGIDATTMQLLVKYGYNVDSSVYPYYENEYFSCHGAPNLPYWPDISAPLRSGNQRDIFELPVTAGFNRWDFDLSNQIHKAISHPVITWARLVGMAWHTNLLRKTYLSPELNSAEDMLKLCRIAIDKGYPVLHMFMHSSSLIDNNNSLLGNENAFEFVTHSVKTVVKTLKEQYDIQFCTISEAAEQLQAMRDDL